jgi:flagellar biosynthesis/type III secretory pathway chaperone
MGTRKTQNELFNLVKEDVNHQFKLLDQKIRALIEFATVLKQEKVDLTEKLRVRGENLDTLSKKVASLRAEREKEKHRILALIEKMDRVNL